jgi:hypothetical protein
MLEQRQREPFIRVIVAELRDLGFVGDQRERAFREAKRRLLQETDQGSRAASLIASISWDDVEAALKE